jgi:Icc-related predicted phosphoesterase
MIEQEGLEGTDPDLVLISGDMVTNFKPKHRIIEAQLQRMAWELLVESFERAWPNAELIAVPGNHDFCAYAIPGRVKSFDKYEAQTITVRDRRITGFRGVPQLGGFWDGEFEDRYLDRVVALLDSEADVILTHTPAYGHFDAVHDTRFVGHRGLAEWFVNYPSSKRRHHVFGHIHECGGLTKEHNGVVFSNAAGTANWLDL